MEKLCKYCKCILNSLNKSGKHLQCKPCKSKSSMAHDLKNIEKRRERVNKWARKIGRVKQYPCETCSKLCYKKYSKSFCSDKCRFMSHVEVSRRCWLWKSSKNRAGYGKSSIGKNYIAAHRVSYILFVGPIEQGKQVCHSCDVPSCVKPAHLWLGTLQDNKNDQLKKDRGGRKLKIKDVLQIRKLYEQGMGSQKIAYLYNVVCATISSIAKRRVWKHI